MSDQITIPTPEAILERIRLCREELAKLKKLYRLSRTAAEAEEAQRLRASPQAVQPEVRHAW
jgi:hypothetical protein